MKTAINTTRRTSYPALMLFGIVYLAALTIVVSPGNVRTDIATLDPVAPTPKGTP
jgi:hypothetical protein